MVETKEELRTLGLSRRDQIDRAERSGKSKKISTRLIESEFFTQCGSMMIYVAFSSEADPGLVLDHALKTGKQVYVPDNIGVLKIGKQDVSRGNPHEIDVVVVPGIIFDKLGNRLGYGNGWYDRFSKRVRPDTKFIGIGFEEQIIDLLPRDEHDLVLSALITEQRVLRFNKPE